MSSDELPTRFAVEFVLSYESLKSRKQRILFTDKLHTRASTRKPLSPPGLVCCQKKGGREKEKKRKEKDQGRWSVATRRGREKEEKKKDQGRQEGGSRKGKAPCARNQEFLFLVHKYLGLEAARLV